jgi:hypothetical protein
MAEELFQTIQSTSRPGFDEIVSSLLQRTCDTKNEIRDAMVTHIPPHNAVRPLADTGVSHKSALVRRTTFCRRS